MVRAEDMYSRVLAERVRILKETPEGVEHMCKEMDKLYNEGVEFGKEQGIAIGERSMKREIVLSLSEMGTSAEKIAQAVKESVSRVRKWIDESEDPVQEKSL